MSNTQYAFLKKDNVPTRETLQASIDQLGFDLKLDPEFTPFEDEGFSPCVLNGESDIGFEIFYEPTKDVVEDDEDFQKIAGSNDYCVSMRWGGSLKDCVSAMIVSAALAKDFGAVISYEGNEPEVLEELLNDTKSLVEQTKVKKAKKVNIYNKFMGKVKKDLAEYLRQFGYRYDSKQQKFLGFHDDLIFWLFFDKAGYGSKVELYFGYGTPLTDPVYSAPEDFSGWGQNVHCFKWNIENENMKDSTEVDKKLNDYLDDIKYIFSNYIFYLNSLRINTFDIEKYIHSEYLNRSPGDITDDYIIEFYDGGKTQDDWTDEDTEKCDALLEEAFPFAPVRQEILENIKQNRIPYTRAVNEHLAQGYKMVDFDNEIYPVELKQLLFENAAGRKIVDLLEYHGYFYVDDKDYRGGLEVANFQHNSQTDWKIKVLLSEHIFLSFEILDEEYFYTVTAYFEQPFQFGWLIGFKTKLEGNIDKAIKYVELFFTDKSKLKIKEKNNSGKAQVMKTLEGFVQ